MTDFVKEGYARNMSDDPGRAARAEDEDAGRRLNYWLGQALRREREAAKVPRSRIAGLLAVSERTVIRRENGESEKGKGKGWGEDIDRVIWAYAYALGVEDPRIFWVKALILWYEEGAAPQATDDDLPDRDFVRPIRDVARRKLRDTVETLEMLLETLRRQGGR